VKGLEGVGQMVAWEEDDLTTSKLRGFDLEKLSTFVDFRDRIFSRITLEAYGKTIDTFSLARSFFMLSVTLLLVTETYGIKGFFTATLA